jgi:hypothetical protein
MAGEPSDRGGGQTGRGGGGSLKNARHRVRVQREAGVDFDDSTRAVLRALYAITPEYKPIPLEDGIDRLAVQLARFDRYERRALSRRRSAMREFDEEGRTPLR